MDSPTVGSAKTWELMRTPHTLADGSTTGYAFGLYHDRYRGVEALHHSGGGMGANSQMLKIPSVGLDIVVLMNRHDVSAMHLADKILDSCLPGLELSSVSALPEAMITGTYRSAGSGRTIQMKAAAAESVWVKMGQQVAVIDGVEVALQVSDDGTWRQSGLLASITKMTIEPRGDREAPDTLRLTAYGNADEFVRQAPPKTPDARSYVGLYRSDAIGTQATIFQTESGTRLSTVGPFGSALFTLDCLADGVLCAKSTSSMPWGGILSFEAQESGFAFSSERTHKLLFRRCM